MPRADRACCLSVKYLLVNDLPVSYLPLSHLRSCTQSGLLCH